MTVEVREVSKTYRLGESEIKAVRSVDLDVHDGEFICIMGPSGSGKSTLLGMMGCLVTPDAGYLALGGVPYPKPGTAKAARYRNDHMGFVFQDFALIPGETAVSNVEIPLLYQRRRRPRRQRKQTAIEALTRVGLSDKAGADVSNLSGGQRQRVAIARALVHTPQLILADEPTGALDAVTGAEIVALMGELADAGCAVVMVTHDHALAAHAHRILQMEDGRIIG